MRRDGQDADWEGIFDTVRGDIAESGYHLVHVGADPPFWYSVGFRATWHHAELLLIGVGFDDSKTIMVALAEEIRTGRRFADGSIDNETFNRPVAFVEIPKDEYFERFPVAIEIYDGTAFSALQVVTPDADGHFPWDSSCDPNLVARQPLLGRAAR